MLCSRHGLLCLPAPSVVLVSCFLLLSGSSACRADELLLFWLEEGPSTNDLVRLDLKSRERERVPGRSVFPYPVSYDPRRREVFWAEQHPPTFEITVLRGGFDQAAGRPLVVGDSPTVVLDRQAEWAYVRTKTREVSRVHLDTGEVASVAQGKGAITGFDLYEPDMRSGLDQPDEQVSLYWIDDSDGVLYQTELAAGVTTEVRRGLELPGNLAVASSEGLVAWAELRTGVRLLDLASGDVMTLATMRLVRGLAADPEGTFYWCCGSSIYQMRAGDRSPTIVVERPCAISAVCVARAPDTTDDAPAGSGD